MRKRLLLAAAAGLLLSTATFGGAAIGAMSPAAETGPSTRTVAPTCKHQLGYPDNLTAGTSGTWGSTTFTQDDGPLTLNVNAGWEVDLCIMKAATPMHAPGNSYQAGVHTVNYPGFDPADGFSHYGLIARPVSTPPPATQVVPEDPAVTQAVCDGDTLTQPSVIPATTANVSYQVNGTVAPGETVTVVATLTGDNVEWGTLPTGWTAANGTAVFTVELDAPTCEQPVDEPPIQVDLPPFPATQPPLPPVQEQLPPPGTPESPQPETPVAPQPETPGVEAAPPPGTPQAPSSLPVTGTATWIMAVLATALLGAGVGMRRIGRES